MLGIALGILFLPLSPGLLPVPRSAAEVAETVLVRLPTAAYEATGQGSLSSRRTLLYGNFVWLELSATDLAGIQATDLPYELRTAPYTLQLAGSRFDPLYDRVQWPSGWDGVRHHGPDLHLLQLVGPTRDEWLERLESDGLEIVQYLHPFTYVVWGDPEALSRSATAEFVRWTGPFVPAYRVLPQWRDLDGVPVRVDLLLYRGADTATAGRQLEALGGQSHGRAVLNSAFEITSLTLPGTALQAAAHIPGVYSIQLEPTDGGLRGEMSNQINANNLDGDNRAVPGYLTWLAGLGLDGADVVIANVDDGVHETHPDLIHRFRPCVGLTCGGDAASDHGTHTAGIMAADGSSGITDGQGFLRGLGMAPGASLVEQLYDPWFAQPGGLLSLMTDSQHNGASLSGNSWGPAGTPQGYDNDTMQVDIGVRDADPATPGNQPLAYVLSIMNGYGDYQTQGSPDEAKNSFTIGATRMQTSGGAQITEIEDLSNTTAHGPALDGRMIPHMVAPGCYVDSTTGLDGHSNICGTSMASPHVSGAVALFIQYYRSRVGGADPSPALIKAAFLAVAHDLAGHKDADGNLLGHPFDSKQGWGRMDAEAVLSPQEPVTYFEAPLVFDDTGQEWVQSLSVADPSRAVRLMLVWTDAPGHGLGGNTPAWNNDLDLLVQVGADIYPGNHFGADGWSQAGSGADSRNNTEGVFLSPGTAKRFTIRVVASNINSDGIPDQGDTTDQDFALVCYNCAFPTGGVSYLPIVVR